LNVNPAMPTAPAGDVYCPYLAAADPTNHLAVPLTPLNNYTWQPAGPVQLAVYSADSSGNLTTTSTATNMPKTAVTSVLEIRISPSGRFLAAAGSTGLQVFHFNGANPITRFTGLLTTDQVDHIFWDNANHLYAVSTSANKLFVFTVTSNTVTRAPGSPYTITSPQDVVVLSR
jgi:6-phosphogluconolactonase (cycloisomerase 2 family)